MATTKESTGTAAPSSISEGTMLEASYTSPKGETTTNKDSPFSNALKELPSEKRKMIYLAHNESCNKRVKDALNEKLGAAMTNSEEANTEDIEDRSALCALRETIARQVKTMAKEQGTILEGDNLAQLLSKANKDVLNFVAPVGNPFIKRVREVQKPLGKEIKNLNRQCHPKLDKENLMAVSRRAVGKLCENQNVSKEIRAYLEHIMNDDRMPDEMMETHKYIIENGGSDGILELEVKNGPMKVFKSPPPKTIVTSPPGASATPKKPYKTTPINFSVSSNSGKKKKKKNQMPGLS